MSNTYVHKPLHVVLPEKEKYFWSLNDFSMSHVINHDFYGRNFSNQLNQLFKQGKLGEYTYHGIIELTEKTVTDSSKNITPLDAYSQQYTFIENVVKTINHYYVTDNDLLNVVDRIIIIDEVFDNTKVYQYNDLALGFYKYSSNSISPVTNVNYYAVLTGPFHKKINSKISDGTHMYSSQEKMIAAKHGDIHYSSFKNRLHDKHDQFDQSNNKVRIKNQELAKLYNAGYDIEDD